MAPKQVQAKPAGAMKRPAGVTEAVGDRKDPANAEGSVAVDSQVAPSAAADNAPGASGVDEVPEVTISVEYIRGERMFVAWVLSTVAGKRLMGPARASREKAEADGGILLKIHPIRGGEVVAAKWRAGECNDREAISLLKDAAKLAKEAEEAAAAKEAARIARGRGRGRGRGKQAKADGEGDDDEAEGDEQEEDCEEQAAAAPNRGRGRGRGADRGGRKRGAEAEASGPARKRPAAAVHAGEEED